MQPFQKNEIKVKVAARQKTLPTDVVFVGGIILLVLVSLVVLIGRPAGFM